MQEDKVVPLFSVIMPTYNRRGFLARAIGSVLAQGWTDWELLVVDDGSTDGTEEVVEDMGDVRIIYVRLEHGGRSRARNWGIQLARGQYLCFLDDDDAYLSHHLEHFAKIIRKWGKLEYVLRTGLYGKRDKGYHPYPIYRRSLRYPDPLHFFLYHPCSLGALCVPAAAGKRLLFSGDLDDWEDTHWILRLLAAYPLVQLRARTYIYDRHEGRGSLTAYPDAAAMLRQLQRVAHAMEQLVAGYPVLRQSISVSNRKRWLSHQYLLYAHQAYAHLGLEEAQRLLGVACAEGLDRHHRIGYFWLGMKQHLARNFGYRRNSRTSSSNLRASRSGAMPSTGTTRGWYCSQDLTK